MQLCWLILVGKGKNITRVGAGSLCKQLHLFERLPPWQPVVPLVPGVDPSTAEP